MNLINSGQVLVNALGSSVTYFEKAVVHIIGDVWSHLHQSQSFSSESSTQSFFLLHLLFNDVISSPLSQRNNCLSEISLNSRIPSRQNKCQFVSISIITGQELTPKKKNRESNFSTFKGCAPFFLSRSSYFCVESGNRIISKIAYLYRRHKVSNTAPWTWKLHLPVMLWFGFWSWLTSGRHFVMFT